VNHGKGDAAHNGMGTIKNLSSLISNKFVDQLRIVKD
jgi:hypothetical protein